jgi:hypothetical protein
MGPQTGTLLVCLILGAVYIILGILSKKAVLSYLGLIFGIGTWMLGIVSFLKG